MVTAELEERERLRAEHHVRLIDGAAEKIRGLGILRVAVKGPEDSDDAMLAYQLGIDDIELHDTYAGVVAASGELSVVGLLPTSTEDYKSIDVNRALWLATGRASVYNVRNPITGEGTELLIANTRMNRE